MTGIKGVGSGVVEADFQERKKGGPFKSFYHFFKRVDLRKVGKKAIENLVEAGCFDFTGWSRDALRESIETMYEAASKEQADAANGFMSLFAKLGDGEEGRFATQPAPRRRSSPLEILLKEKELLGFFLTGHPMDSYGPVLKRLSCISLSKGLEMGHDAIFRAAFIVESLQVRVSAKTQRKFAILMINDGLESHELPVWSELYEEKSHLLKENQLLYAVLQVDKREETPKLSCRWLDDLTRADEAMIDACDRAFDKAKQQASFQRKRKDAPPKKEAPPMEKATPKKLKLTMCAKEGRLSHILKLKELLEKHRGATPVQIDFQEEGSPIASLQIESRWGVTPSSELQLLLQKIPGILAVE